MGRVRVKPPEQLSKHFFSSKEKMDQKNMDHKGEVGGGVPGPLGSTTKKNFLCVFTYWKVSDAKKRRMGSRTTYCKNIFNNNLKEMLFKKDNVLRCHLDPPFRPFKFL